MGGICTPKPVMLIIGILAKNESLVFHTRKTLQNFFSDEELFLPPFPFQFTNYYEKEIGSNPVRAFIAYETLLDRTKIPEIKLWTNELELKIAEENQMGKNRPVNIDPGYMTLGQFFLATTKDQRQRVYIRDGIFVEPTLYFEAGHFHPFDWTYRDYQSQTYIQFLETVRMRLAYRLSTGIPYGKRHLKNAPAEKK